MNKAPAALLLLLFALVSAWGQDFSGAWELKSAQAESGSLPEAPAAVLQIQHKDKTVHCTAVISGQAQFPWEFTIDGKESRSKSQETTLVTIAKWEGSALLINTIVNRPVAGYTQMDRWTISRDGATLTIHREIVRKTGGAEATLVYGRQGHLPQLAKALRPPVPEPAAAAAPKVAGAGTREPTGYTVEQGTRIPLSLINSVSTKQSVEGDRLYLTTSFPISANGRIVIPPGSYVAGTLTFVKRPGRVHGRGELYLRFDSLMLPNGVTRDFRSRPGALDGQTNGELDRGEGKIKSEGSKGTDVRTIGETTATGASVGALAGAAAGHAGMGVGIGAAAGAAAGVMGVLLSRGPDLVLARGTTIDMVLDRKLVFAEDELVSGWRRTPPAP